MRYIQKDIEYILRIKKYIFIAVAIFLISMMIGVVITEKTIEGKDMARSIASEMIKINKPTHFGRMIEIFETNIYNSIIALLFGIGSIYIAITNGIAIGSAIDLFSSMHGGFISMLLMILPHGIIEIPIILISAGIGLKFGYNTFILLKSKDRNNEYIKLLQELKQGTRFYIRWIVPALIIAAFIESYITPEILKMIF